MERKRCETARLAGPRVCRYSLTRSVPSTSLRPLVRCRCPACQQPHDSVDMDDSQRRSAQFAVCISVFRIQSAVETRNPTSPRKAEQQAAKPEASETSTKDDAFSALQSTDRCLPIKPEAAERIVTRPRARGTQGRVQCSAVMAETRRSPH